MEKQDIPLGFGMALAMEPKAMQIFNSLPESKRREIISGTHTVTSRSEMQQYVNSIISMYR